jgi:hypothetical protein
VGGSVVVDVVCDLVPDAAGRPVSASLARVVGAETVALPGGLLRLTLLVER